MDDDDCLAGLGLLILGLARIPHRCRHFMVIWFIVSAIIAYIQYQEYLQRSPVRNLMKWLASWAPICRSMTRCERTVSMWRRWGRSRTSPTSWLTGPFWELPEMRRKRKTYSDFLTANFGQLIWLSGRK